MSQAAQLQGLSPSGSNVPFRVTEEGYQEQSPDVTFVGDVFSALNVDLLTGQVNGWFDASLFQSASIQIIGSAGITAGQVIFEQTNDITLAPAGVPIRAVEISTVNANPNVGALSITASTARIFKVQIDSKFVRVRVSTAFVGGTVRAVAVMSQRSASYSVINVQQATAANLQTTATISGNPVLGAGSNTIGNVNVIGQGAEDAAATGNAVRVGGRVRTAHLTTLAAGDAADAHMTTAGQQIVKVGGLTESQWNASAALTTTTAVALAAAGGAGLKRHMTGLQAINTGASAVELILLDGTTERWRMTLPPNVPCDFTFGETHLNVTANTALNANLSAAGTVRVNAQGYTAP